MLFSHTKKLISAFLVLTAAFLLTGCMPDNYTPEAQEAITNAHKDEITAWFTVHLPGAKITSIKAEDEGLELVHFIGGYFELDGVEYPYSYDFDNACMYTGRRYEEMMDCATDEIAAALSIPSSQIRLETLVLDVETAIENTPGKVEGTIGHLIRGCMPEDRTPEDFARWVICDGNDDPVTIVRFKAYTDHIPDYDPSLFDILNGVDEIDYIKAISFGYDDVYHVTYSRNKAVAEHCYMQKLRDDLYAGYLYDSEEIYDDNGALIENSSDIDRQDPEPQFVFDPDGTLQIRIPDGMARPAVLTNGGKNYISVTGSTETATRKWSNSIKLDNYSYLPGGPYDYYSNDCIFDSSGLILYYYSSSAPEKGEYSIDL